MNADLLRQFEESLKSEEKSPITIEKYLRDAAAFLAFLGDREADRELVLEYKRQLQDRGYALRSINSMLASVNKLLSFMGKADCRVKRLRQQRQVYCPEERELSREEYLRLLAACGKDRRLNLILQTICSTGIRISELKYFTLEEVRRGEIRVSCKGKNRQIFVPAKLKKQLMDYAHLRRIESGPIFVSKNGKALDRSNIWAQMKRLCAAAGVSEAKVFPHNLRKLFAKMFYRIEKDIAKLADVLGHSSIETTRIYIMTSGREHRRMIDKLGLLI